MFDSNQFFGAQAGFYPNPIDQSLRFNDDDSAYLSRTPASAGNRKTWTYSVWVKLGNLGTNKDLFAPNIADQTQIWILSTGAVRFYQQNTSVDVQTSALFRDPSAWYHFVFEVDTTQATAADRIKIYVNGEQITAFDTANYPTQNTDMTWNTTNEHRIGGAGSAYLDGYLAEVHFTDGTAYDADAFGEFKEGVWVAKAPSVTYGTNGFYLDFANSADIGNDVSGEGNDWTPNNFTASDVVLDSPTDNFATLNPLDKSSAITLSDGNLSFTHSTSGHQMVSSSFGVNSGKWYAEVTLTNIGGTYAQIGISPVTTSNTTYTGNNGYGYLYNGDKQGLAASSTSYGSSYANNDVIGIALDLDAGSITFYKNNVSQGVAFTGIDTDLTWRISVSTFNSGAGNVNFGQLGFTYTPPTGYLALSTANLPDPAIDPAQGESPEDYFNTVLFTSNGGVQSVTGVGFQPDLLWLKRRDSTGGNALFDAIRGASKFVVSHLTDAEYTDVNYLTSFDSDGFSLGTSNFGSGASLVGWNWKANGSGVSNTDGSITSTVSANTESGFSIVSYTGNGTSGATIGHGLTSAPELVITKNRDGTDSWLVSTDIVNDLFLNSTNAADAYNRVSAFGDSTITMNNSTAHNGSGTAYISYMFHSVEGFSKFAQYEGGSSPFVYTGFRPALIWIKSVDSTSDWYCFDDKREGYNVDNDFLELNDTEDEDTADLIDILSNGFKIRGSSGTDPNVSETYIYACWASNPFKYSNAR